MNALIVIPLNSLISAQPLVTDTAVDPDFVNDQGNHTGTMTTPGQALIPLVLSFVFLNNVLPILYRFKRMDHFTNPKNRGWTIFTPFQYRIRLHGPQERDLCPLPGLESFGWRPNRSKVFRHIISNRLQTASCGFTGQFVPCMVVPTQLGFPDSTESK